jgi:hypothetical protein
MRGTILKEYRINLHRMMLEGAGSAGLLGRTLKLKAMPLPVVERNAVDFVPLGLRLKERRYGVKPSGQQNYGSHTDRKASVVHRGRRIPPAKPGLV